MKKHTGFTLVELMITLSLVAIMAAMAVPSFTGFIANNRLAAQANELVASLNLARSESIKRNTRVTVCPTSTGTGCGGTWGQGWLVFVDAGNPGVVDVGDAILRVGDAVSADMGLTTTASPVMFQSIGLTTQSTFTLTATNCTGNNVRLIDVAPSGRVATTKGSC